jgi:L-ascorbate metabolism protein UlaG (beta-lactamase superfamily)
VGDELDALDHHRELDVTVFTPPIGAFTMDRHDAAELAEAIGPELVVPIHYNTFETLEADSGAFASDVAKRGVPVALDET